MGCGVRGSVMLCVCVCVLWVIRHDDRIPGPAQARPRDDTQTRMQPPPAHKTMALTHLKTCARSSSWRTRSRPPTVSTCVTVWGIVYVVLWKRGLVKWIGGKSEEAIHCTSPPRHPTNPN